MDVESAAFGVAFEPVGVGENARCVGIVLAHVQPGPGEVGHRGVPTCPFQVDDSAHDWLVRCGDEDVAVDEVVVAQHGTSKRLVRAPWAGWLQLSAHGRN